MRKYNPLLIAAACICFAIAVLEGAGIVTIEKADLTDLGLFLGFLAFLVK
jgi:hypothetical protein